VSAAGVEDPWLVQYIDAGEVHSFEVATYEGAEWWASWMRTRWALPVNIVRRSLHRIIGNEWAELASRLSKESAG
jgi:hypothetical protein